ncbi:MAG: response regulator [Candidatus Omnitrophica bacterium]|nr:response regulator [Candidatus Omnitrophota bacterium]
MAKVKILVIDDEADLLETIKFRLESAGYEVLTAQDAVSGIDIAREELPELIIMDVMMPGMDGFEALEKIKEDASTKKIPTIILSCGKEEEEWAKKSLQLGAAGYVVKPFDAKSLLFTVEKFAERKKEE